MNNQRERFEEKSIREVFRYSVNDVMFKTDATAEQFARLVDYVQTLNKGKSIYDSLYDLLTVSGFYVQKESMGIAKMFNL